MALRKIADLPRELVKAEIVRGGRCMRYEYCLSCVFATSRRLSPTYLLREGESGRRTALFYTAISLVLGWWGIPWGIVYTPASVGVNLSGGRDVTAEVLAWLHKPPCRAEAAAENHQGPSR